VTVLDVQSDSCTVNSASEIVASFLNGIPVTSTAVFPSVSLFQDCDSDMSTLCTDNSLQTSIYATSTTSLEGITNDLVVSNDASNTVTCGFAGGCHRIIEAPGLTASMKANRARVDVCGFECVLDESASTDTQAACEVPYIQTLASIEQFHIIQPGEILGEVISTSDSFAELAFDSRNLPVASSTGANCYIGTMFAGDSSGYMIGVLEEVKFFIDYFSDKSVYNGYLKL
jgi:hypothetical protein